MVTSPAPGPRVDASGSRASTCKIATVRNCSGLSFSGLCFGGICVPFRCSHCARERELRLQSAERTLAEFERAAIELGDIAHNGETKARSRHTFIETLAAFADARAFFFVETGAIVFHAQFEFSIQRGLGGDAHPRMRPFAAIVDEIARHLLQVLLVAAKRKLWRP